MKHPWMPLFLGDLFADTLHLSAQEFGAYVLLFGHAWKHDAKIAVADLQHVARVNNYHWPKVREKIAPFFSTSEVPNFWHHARVHHELQKAAQISNKRKGAAQQMHVNRHANAAQKHTQSQSQSLKELSLGKEGNGTAVQMHARQGPSPDLGNSYRAPPANRDQDLPITNANREALAKLNDQPTEYPPLTDDEKRLVAIEPKTWTPARILAQRNQNSGR